MKTTVTLFLASIVAASIVVLVTGCGGGGGDGGDGASAVDSRYLLEAEPAGAQDVIQARASAATGDDVIVAGRIGGRIDPWIEGSAAFAIIDRSLKACSDIEGDECPTPWDYCCESDLDTAAALVQLVDESGNVVKTDARQLLGVKELETVVVRGKAVRDEADNLTIRATSIFVRR
jgi:hypothetical protein